MSEDTDRKLDIDWLTTLAGALAAVSSAVLLSTLGAAGTMIGAALGSVTLTVGGAFYRHGLTRSRERLAQGHAVARHKVAIAQAEVRRASRRPGHDRRDEAHLSHAEASLDEAKQDLETDAISAQSLSRRDRLLALPWKRISLGAAATFAVSVLAITAFELVAGQSVSSITGGSDGSGGTTISRIGGGDRDGARQQDEDPGPTDDDAPSQPDPSEQPSDGSSPSPDAPLTPEEPTEDPIDPSSPAPSPTDQTTPTPQLEDPTETAPGG